MSIFAGLPRWQGRASKNCPVGNFSEEPACRGGQFRHPFIKAEFFING